MNRRTFDHILTVILVLVSLGACVLFLLLPLNSFDTGLVYQGF